MKPTHSNATSRHVLPTWTDCDRISGSCSQATYAPRAQPTPFNTVPRSPAAAESAARLLSLRLLVLRLLELRLLALRLLSLLLRYCSAA
jgi:hypothetical protein